VYKRQTVRSDYAKHQSWMSRSFFACARS